MKKVLTGATGALGAHILAALTERTNLQVVALVRAMDDDQADGRVRQNLATRRLHSVDGSRLPVLAANLCSSHLGLTLETYEDLHARAELIIHVSGIHLQLLRMNT